LLDKVLAMAERGFVTGASGRNWASYGTSVQLAAGVTSAQQALLCDPQTSGGLLVACAEDAVGEVMAIFERQGFEGAAVIGTMVGGDPKVAVGA
jgi:selenide,water dikinase